ncbi:acid sphingomyelinase-like phosphodiesterase 3b [Rhodnius prolixus]|uniref:acid sphingomyelinase-like phosphodiesterase 3b n=1 Tax=Rhodnius prolixus TaxID=13249 RepID=UPI003D18E784
MQNDRYEVNNADLSQQKTGYFWQLSDLHWDPSYSDRDGGCWRSRPGNMQPPSTLGEYSCDSPWALVQSAVDTMKYIEGDDLEFILWTGDGVTDSLALDEKVDALKNLTDLLSRTFTSQFVFPVLGEADPSSPEILIQLGQLWRHWLPTEALNSFIKGGYYMIEQKSRRLRLIALNTNLWIGTGTEDDPGGQWYWLETLMEKSSEKKATVYLVGHVAPGFDERQGAPPRLTLAPEHNDRYLRLIQRYSDIITGQFFGHLHSDTFRLIYDNIGVPVSTIFLAPAVTPRRTSSGVNNPALRLYKVDTDTGQVRNYMQFYMDLAKSNEVGEANWSMEYNFTRYYGLEEVSPTELHELVQMFTSSDGMALFGRYWMANSVRSYNFTTNSAWTNSHYCAITQLEYTLYQNCLNTRVSALAALDTHQEPAVATDDAVSSPQIHNICSALLLLPLFCLTLR